MTKAIKDKLYRNVRSIDREIGQFVEKQNEKIDVIIASVLASFSLKDGNSCIYLKSVTEKEIWGEEEPPTGIIPDDREKCQKTQL